MTTVLIPVTPSKSNATHKAAAFIYQGGAVTREQLFDAVYFGSAYTHGYKLKAAFDSDWLRETEDGKIELTEYSKRHFERQTAKKHFGEPAAPHYRPSFRASPGLSKQYRTNSRGTRIDIPEWSQRPADFCFKPIGGGEA